MGTAPSDRGSGLISPNYSIVVVCIRRWYIVGEDDWYMVGANPWYIVGEDHWYMVGANPWYIIAEDYWYIVARGVTNGK